MRDEYEHHKTTERKLAMKRFFDWIHEDEIRFYPIASIIILFGITFVFMMATVALKVMIWFWNLILL
jgi:hypothetical protein